MCVISIGLKLIGFAESVLCTKSSTFDTHIGSGLFEVANILCSCTVLWYTAPYQLVQI